MGNDKKEISYSEVDFAIDRTTVGMQKTTGTNFPDRQRLVAYHEAGHAVMGLLTPDYDMVTKVTIVPRTNGAGCFTLFTPSEERLESGMYSKKYLEGQLAVALGGRVAEEIIYGEDEVTTGASNDLQQVRSIARRMVAQWGFANDAMGNARRVGVARGQRHDAAARGLRRYREGDRRPGDRPREHGVRQVLQAALGQQGAHGGHDHPLDRGGDHRLRPAREDARS